MWAAAAAVFAQWQPLVTSWPCVVLPQGLCAAMLMVALCPGSQVMPTNCISAHQRAPLPSSPVSCLNRKGSLLFSRLGWVPRVGSLGAMALPTSPIAAGCAIPEVLSAWRAGLVAGLQVGRANGYSVCVWGQQFQSPMFLGTQPPYETTVIKCNIQQDVCIGRYRGQLRTEDEVHSFFPVWTDLDRLVTFLKLLFSN